MRALILAAGWATRMGALCADTPKQLLPIGARTPLDFVADALERIPALSSIDVLTHEGLLERFETWASRRGGAVGIWSNDVRSFGDRRGAVGDLHHFLETAQVDEDLLVLGGDQVFDFDLAPLAALATREPTIALVDVGSQELVRRYASVSLDPGGYITRFVEKDPDPPTTLAAPAIYGLPAGSLAEVSAYLDSGGAADNLGWLAEWLVARGPVRGVVMQGLWIDVGHPDEYQRACRQFGTPSTAPGVGLPAGPGER